MVRRPQSKVHAIGWDRQLLKANWRKMTPERYPQTNAGFVGSNGRRATSSGHERYDDEDHGDNEQHMSNPGRFSSYTTGTERFGYQSNDQKNDRVS